MSSLRRHNCPIVTRRYFRNAVMSSRHALLPLSVRDCLRCRQMLRDELALRVALKEELTYEANPEDLSQLQAMWSGKVMCTRA